MLIEAIDRIEYINEIQDNAKVMKELEGLFPSMCQKYIGQKNYPSELMSRLNGEIWEAPSRVQTHNVWFFKTVVPPNAIHSFCQGFKDIPEDKNYQQF
jgi:hypothetical protein